MKVRISWNEIDSKKNVSRKFKRLDVSSLEELITTIMDYETAHDKCCVTVKNICPKTLVKHIMRIGNIVYILALMAIIYIERRGSYENSCQVLRGRRSR